MRQGERVVDESQGKSREGMIESVLNAGLD